MTLLDDPPTARADGGDWLPVPAARPAAGWRLAARLAWREVLRRRARTTLVVLLIAVPSFAMAAAAVIYRTSAAGDAQWNWRGPADIVVNNSMAYSTDGVMGQDRPLGERGGAPTAQQLADNGVPADALTTSYLFTPANVVPSEPPASSTVTRDDQLWVTFSDIDLTDPNWAELVTLSGGRVPSAADEMLVSPAVAKALGVDIGDEVTLERPSGTWTVVGTGRWAPDFWHDLMVVGEFDPARLAEGAAQYETLIDLPDDVSASDADRIASRFGGLVVGTTPFWTNQNQSGELTLGWVMGVMAFLVFGIVIAAAFATSARKQLLTVGQLSANGAPVKLIARVLSWQGLWSGLLGGVVGVGVTMALLPFTHAAAEQRIFHRTISWVIRPLDLVIVVATAAAAGLLAALVPSRSLARTSVLAALAGRRPLKAVPRWLLPVGIVAAAGGTGLVTLALMAGRSSADSTPFAIAAVIGGAGIAIGTCCMTPWIVQQFARLAARVPMAGKLSLRSLARSRGRSAAVISAIAVTVGLATAAVGGVERSVEQTLSGDRYLPRNVLVLRLDESRLVKALGPEWADELAQTADGTVTTATVPPLEDVEIPAAAVERIEEIMPGARIEPLQFAVEPGGEIQLVDGYWAGEGAQVPVASDATFRAGGWSDAAQRAFSDTEGWAQLVPDDLDGFAGGGFAYPFQPLSGLPDPERIEVPGSSAGGAYPMLISADVAEEHGFDVVTRGAIVTLPEPLTAEQREEASDLYLLLNPAAYGREASVFVEPGDPPALDPSEMPADAFEYWGVEYQYVDVTAERALWVARGIALAAAVILIGIVVAIGLALAASDNRAERDLLSVVGARPASLRRMAAWNAVTMTLIGIAIGVPIGFVPAWFVTRAMSYLNRGIPFPALFVGALVLIVPSLMLVLAWVGSAVSARWGRQPTPRRAD